MILIAGLGNPGKDYELTRHNIGFEIVDRLSESLESKSLYHKFNSLIIESSFEKKKLLLLKPQLFMNNSGSAVAACMDSYGDEISSLMVVHDDLDIEPGNIKLKRGGSTAGHKGLESIANKTGSNDFYRLRFGVGRPPGRMDPVDFVLRHFKKKEIPGVELDIARSAEAIKDYIKEGIDFAMNKYN